MEQEQRPVSCDEVKLKAYFEEFGKIKDLLIPPARKDGKPTGVGILTFHDPSVISKVVTGVYAAHIVAGEEIIVQRARLHKDQVILQGPFQGISSDHSEDDSDSFSTCNNGLSLSAGEESSDTAPCFDVGYHAKSVAAPSKATGSGSGDHIHADLGSRFNNVVKEADSIPWTDRMAALRNHTAKDLTVTIPPVPPVLPSYPYTIDQLKLKRDYEVGDILPVYAAFVCSPQTYFVVHDEEGELPVLLERMAKEMENACPNSLELTEMPPVNSVVCAMFSVGNNNNEKTIFLVSNEQWYRAVILYHTGEKAAEVRFVDFGNSETRSLSDMRRMTDEWAQIPRMTFKVTISGMKPVHGTEYSKEDTKKAHDIVHNTIGEFRVHEVQDDEVIGNMVLDGKEEGEPKRTVQALLVSEGIAALDKKKTAKPSTMPENSDDLCETLGLSYYSTQAVVPESNSFSPIKLRFAKPEPATSVEIVNLDFTGSAVSVQDSDSKPEPFKAMCKKNRITLMEPDQAFVEGTSSVPAPVSRFAKPVAAVGIDTLPVDHKQEKSETSSSHVVPQVPGRRPKFGCVNPVTTTTGTPGNSAESLDLSRVESPFRNELFGGNGGLKRDLSGSSSSREMQNRLSYFQLKPSDSTISDVGAATSSVKAEQISPYPFFEKDMRFRRIFQSVGQLVQVQVVGVNNKDHHIWLAQLGPWKEALRSALLKTDLQKLDTVPAVGSAICVRAKNEKFPYRAIIVKREHEPLGASILLTDYGGEPEWAALETMYSMTKELMDIGRLAVPCTVYGADPPTTTILEKVKLEDIHLLNTEGYFQLMKKDGDIFRGTLQVNIKGETCNVTHRLLLAAGDSSVV